MGSFCINRDLPRSAAAEIGFVLHNWVGAGTVGVEIGFVLHFWCADQAGAGGNWVRFDEMGGGWTRGI